MPYNGTAGHLEDAVCTYPDKIDSQLELLPNVRRTGTREKAEADQVAGYQLMLADAFSERSRIITNHSS